MSSSSKNSSEGDPERRQEPPSKVIKESWLHKNVSKAVNQIQKIRERKEKHSDSQQSSPNNENPDVSKMDEEPFAKDGKTTFKPKHLKICWGEDSQYWITPEGDGPVELLQVCWLDVSGELTNATRGKTYEISFKLSMNKDNSFGWKDPVYVMARIGDKGEYKRVGIDLSQLDDKEVELPKEKCRIEFKSDEKAENEEKTLHFGLYEVWTNKWKGGLRIHEAIVQELTAEDSGSTSNTRSDKSKVQEGTADNSASTSKNPPTEPEVQEATADNSTEPEVQEATADNSASTSKNPPTELEVQEETADNSASTSKNPLNKPEVQEATADNSTSTSKNPPTEPEVQEATADSSASS